MYFRYCKWSMHNHYKTIHIHTVIPGAGSREPALRKLHDLDQGKGEVTCMDVWGWWSVFSYTYGVWYFERDLLWNFTCYAVILTYTTILHTCRGRIQEASSEKASCQSGPWSRERWSDKQCMHGCMGMMGCFPLINTMLTRCVSLCYSFSNTCTCVQ